MVFMSGKALRLSEFINPKDGRTLLLKMDQGMMVGPLEATVDLERAVEKFSEYVDGIILSPGQAGRLIKCFLGRSAPALLVRADWTNLFRDESFTLPVQKIEHVMVASALEALTLGAYCVVAFFFVGYEDDEDEARNMNAVTALARESERVGIPLLVEAMPIGPRITKTNYAECTDLAMRMAVEAGADVVAVPYTGDTGSFRRIVEAAKVPVLTLDFGNTEKTPIGIVKEALEADASGIIVGARTLREPNPAENLEALKRMIHIEG